MAIFKRIRDIVTASVNDMVDRVEDPEQVLNQMIREMDQSIAELRRATADAIAARKLSEKRHERGAAEHARLQEQAEASVRAGDDDEARRLLATRRNVDTGLRELAADIASQEAAAERLKRELRAIEDKAQEARMKRDTLLAKRRAAATRQRMADRAKEGSSAQDVSQRLLRDIDAVADAYSDDIDRDLAQADAEGELRDLHSGRGTDHKIDDELETLKRKMED